MVDITERNFEKTIESVLLSGGPEGAFKLCRKGTS
jgi:hypothetical protein